MSRARSVVAGVLLANAVPHGVHGVTGQAFPTPFADPPGIGLSSPALNVLWSALNLVGAGVALRGARVRPLALIVGAAAMASFLAAYFGPTSPRRRG
ncbi:hypothetical protein [Microbacterium telephonicum]|uniref:Uncharacterized protein n=1 Tax=Microbacterium telephonicum TaxID=1714841 RepID=A0A498CDF5_9MICO|nr:hypothetical protein [Microbacterium telephonicum]RLK52969.1 hypothetical protein C7474_0931 [Microbacterium telephonicum]